jgi:hypothetical protein
VTVADRELDVVNVQMVGALRGQVVVHFPVTSMTPEEAIVHAAWLVAVASVIDCTVPPFGDVLTAVRNT